MTTMTPAKFHIDGGADGNGATFEGYHEPEKRWNGWACPWFSIDTVRSIAEWLDTEGTQQFHKVEILHNSFVRLTSALGTPDQWDEQVGAQIIFTGPDAAVMVYGLGAYAWTWSETDGDH